MTRIRTLLGLAILMVGVAPAFAGSPAESPFVGKWTATAELPGAKISETLTVVKTGDGHAITAKPVVAPVEGQPEAGPGKDIVLDGNKFSYKRAIAAPGVTIEITYTGVVSGDTFTGEADLGGTKIPYTGVRIKEGG